MDPKVRRPRPAHRLACGSALWILLLAVTGVQAQTEPPAATAPAQPQQASATPPATARPASPAPSAPAATPTAGASAAAPATATATADPKDEPQALPREERPIIVLERFAVEPENPAPGQTFRLELKLRNRGEHLAENVQVSLSSPAFLPAGEGSVLFANTIDEGDSEDLDTELRVAVDAKGGSQPLTLGLRWDDSWGGNYSDETSIGITVAGGGSGRPVLAVTGTRLPKRVLPGVPFSLQLDLLNTGGKEARAVTLAPTAGPLALVGGASGLLNIAPGASATVTVQVVSAEVQSPGATSQTVELRYSSPEGEAFTDPVPLGISVSGDAATGPVPFVDAFRVLPIDGRASSGQVHPGETFDLELDLRNVGRGDALQTRLILGAGGGGAGAGAGAGTGAGAASLGVFAPVGTSNVRFLDTLGAGQTRTERFRLVADGAAKPGAYTLELGFSYVDADGVAASDSATISLLVSRRLNLVINPVQVLTSTLVGQPMSFVVDIVNQGSSTTNLGNAEILVDGHFALGANPPQYVGQLDAAGFYTLQAELTPVKAGKSEVTVRLHFQDDFNQEQTLERVFEVLVEENEVPEADPETLKPRLEPGSTVLRVLKGLLGLGASPRLVFPEAPAFEGPVPMEVPLEGPAMVKPRG